MRLPDNIATSQPPVDAVQMYFGIALAQTEVLHMHSAAISTPAFISVRTQATQLARKPVLKGWLLRICAVVLPKLLETVAIIILVLIPWNTAS